jgi:hypothetical protein
VKIAAQSDDLKFILRDFNYLGVEIIADFGQFRIHINPENVNELLANPILLFAKLAGVPMDVFMEYNNGVHLRCAATTRKGKRCKLPVDGWRPHDDIKKYATLRGGYCSLHGGCRVA